MRIDKRARQRTLDMLERRRVRGIIHAHRRGRPLGGRQAMNMSANHLTAFQGQVMSDEDRASHRAAELRLRYLEKTNARYNKSRRRQEDRRAA